MEALLDEVEDDVLPVLPKLDEPPDDEDELPDEELLEDPLLPLLPPVEPG